MIIGFRTLHPFKERILAGIKIHTLREDKSNRWRAGMMMHMANGVRTKFFKKFKETPCTGIQEIVIINSGKHGKAITIDGKCFYREEPTGLFGTPKSEKEWLEQFVINDGFENAEQFWAWFKKDFKGKIIHWTGYRYN